MNANELADWVEQQSSFGWSGDFGKFLIEIAAMLRQQQGEIAQLKHINKNWQISENILLLELEKLQHRELTDEEIKQVWSGVKWNGSDPIELTFARAILRKAQE